MNFSNIINEIATSDPEVFEKTSMRRTIISNWSKRIALTALPFAVGSLFKTAYGKNTDVITDTLNFALTLEYLEAEFYAGAAAVAGLIPAGAATAAIQTIAAHEASHVITLKDTINALGGTPVPKPQFDFTAGGTFADVYSNYQTFLAVAQTFEDTGVRAYKGQAGNLMSDNAILNAALRIHSVEARHAAHIRSMRRATGATNVKPWITLNQSGINSTAVQASYNGEEVTSQLMIPIVGIGGQPITVEAASESFDEPLDKTQILAIVSPFIKP